MKKSLLLFFTFLFFAICIKAQYVTIPDIAFRNFLQGKYPTCFNGSGMMDTTCTTIISEDTLYCADSLFANIDGIQYFKSLMLLDCSNNKLSTLPALPATLLYLYCANNVLIALPALPPNLIYLDCSDNQLNSLPELSTTLRSLYCYDNNIYCFPTLHHLLGIVDFDSSKIHCIPDSVGATFFNGLPNNFQYVSMPVCNASNNAANCAVAKYLVYGKVYYDNNGNGIQDANEPYKIGLTLSLSDNNITYIDSTDNNGFYQLFADNPGNYSLIPASLQFPYKAVPSLSVISLNVPATSIQQDIALQSSFNNPDSLEISGKGDFTTGGFYAPLFPYMTPNYYSGEIFISYQNNGTTPVNPVITVDYDSSFLKYTVSTNSAIINTGTSFVLTDSTLKPGESRNFTLYFADSSSTRLVTLPYPFITTANIIAADTSSGNSIAFENRVIGLLPLKLTAFNAFKQPDNTSLLIWNTADEINTKSFTIEESIDGIHFTSIASIAAKGKSSNSYSYNAGKLTAAITYFRLKMIDANAKYTYSTIVKIKSPVISNTDIELLPNPANSWFNIHTNNIALINTTARLINSQGIVVKNILLQQNVKTIDVSHLPAGLYYLQAQSVAKKIMIIK